MEAELFGKFFKIMACGIADICPDDIVLVSSKLANVGRDAVLSKLLSPIVQTDCINQ
jgi:hypothetical protein